MNLSGLDKIVNKFKELDENQKGVDRRFLPMYRALIYRVKKNQKLLHLTAINEIYELLVSRDKDNIVMANEMYKNLKRKKKVVE